MDDAALSSVVFQSLIHTLRSAPAPSNTHVKICDLGCGLLPMLSHLTSPTSGLFRPNSKVQSVEYHAYESNLKLLPEIFSVLSKLGYTTVTNTPPYTFFKEFETFKDCDGSSWTHFFRKKKKKIQTSSSIPYPSVTVYLHMHDFRSSPPTPPSKPPDLIVGSAFADLFDPTSLVSSLLKFAPGSSPLLYFPITYAGMTICDDMSASGPSDVAGFAMYNQALKGRGHSLDPGELGAAIERHGGSVLSEETTTWVIDKETNPTMWGTMLYFFGTTAVSKFAERGHDVSRWLRRLAGKREMRVYNRDILARLGPVGGDEAKMEVGEGDGDGDDYEVVFQKVRGTESQSDDAGKRVFVRKEIGADAIFRNVFASIVQVISNYTIHTKQPRDVTCRKATLPELAPDEVEVEAVCSLISSGTELKVFRGDVDEDAAVDINIEDMKGKKFEYPMVYGYSLVGRVVRCGEEVDEGEVSGSDSFYMNSVLNTSRRSGMTSSSSRSLLTGPDSPPSRPSSSWFPQT